MRPNGQKVLHQCSFQNGASVLMFTMSVSAIFRKVIPQQTTRTDRSSTRYRRDATAQPSVMTNATFSQMERFMGPD